MVLPTSSTTIPKHFQPFSVHLFAEPTVELHSQFFIHISLFYESTFRLISIHGLLKSTYQLHPPHKRLCGQTLGAHIIVKKWVRPCVYYSPSHYLFGTSSNPLRLTLFQTLLLSPGSSSHISPLGAGQFLKNPTLPDLINMFSPLSSGLPTSIPPRHLSLLRNTGWLLICYFTCVTIDILLSHIFTYPSLPGMDKYKWYTVCPIPISPIILPSASLRILRLDMLQARIKKSKKCSPSRAL